MRFARLKVEHIKFNAADYLVCRLKFVDCVRDTQICTTIHTGSFGWKNELNLKILD